MVNVGGLNILSVTSTSRCNAADTTGCRAEAPSVPEHAFLISADPATNTIYAASLSLPRIDVLNGATCHHGHLAGCAPVRTRRPTSGRSTAPPTSCTPLTRPPAPSR